MKVIELLEALSELPETRKYASRRNLWWPMEFRLDGPTFVEEAESAQPVVYLTEAAHVGYLPGVVARELGGADERPGGTDAGHSPGRLLSMRPMRRTSRVGTEPGGWLQQGLRRAGRLALPDAGRGAGTSRGAAMNTVIGYLRVSTREQADSGLGIASQRRTITEEAERRGWEVRWVTDDGYTARNVNRPGYREAIAR